MIGGLKYLSTHVRLKVFHPLIKVGHIYSAKPCWVSAKMPNIFSHEQYHNKYKSYHNQVSSVTWFMIRGLKYLSTYVRLKVFQPLIKVGHIYSAKPGWASAKMPAIFSSLAVPQQI